MAVDIDGYLRLIKDASDGENVRDAIVSVMQEINKDSAFKVMNTTIKTNLSDMNKTYSAPSGQVWKQVTLDITDDTSGETINKGNQTAYDFEVNNYTAPGTYDAKTEHGENAIWGNVIVNVDHSGEWEGIVDNVVISTGDLDETGTYSASTQGLTAFKSVTFSNVDPVSAGGGWYDPNGQATFKITFDPNGGVWSDGTTAPKVKNMRMNDSFEIAESVTKAGDSFIQWVSNKGNTKVRESEIVKAKWDNPSILPDEIDDSWATIMINRGDPYPIGAFKTMDLRAEIPYSADLGLFPDLQVDDPTAKYIWEATFVFVKVAYGENNTSSSWVSMLPVYGANGGSNCPIPQHIMSYEDNYQEEDYNPADYSKSLKIKWLNSVFLDYVIPTYKNSIQPVKKGFRFTNNLGVNMNHYRESKIWIPSVKEFWITGYDDQEGYPDVPPDLETGIEELFTKADGKQYFSAYYPLSNGEQRKALMEKISTHYPGAAGTFRDMCYGGDSSHVVPLPSPMASPLNNTTVIHGRGTSQSLGINPYIIGFCL